ncbi:hypothetical protein MMC29_003091 [Sticta canariensis]|nr:hypothetical protein [Sticta canariensis]
MAPATPRPMTGSSMHIAALEEGEAVVEEVLEPLEPDEPDASDVELDPDLPVVLVAFTEPVVTVVFLLPEEAMTLETGLGTDTKLVFTPGDGVPATTLGGDGVPATTLAADGWVRTGDGCDVAGVVTGSGWVVTGLYC